MGLLGDFTAYVDSLKRGVKNTLSDTISDPIGLLSRRLSQVSESLPEWVISGGSVMPQGGGELLPRPSPQEWGTNVALNAPTMGLLGHTVYHGSPHKFDRFDASKIGTGEGAQAYGHGVYLAESPEVAKGYASAVTSQRLGLGTMDAKPMAQLSKVERQALMDLKLAGGDVDKAIAQLSRPAKGYEESYAARRAVLEQVAAGQKRAELAKGSLYTVDLPDEWLPKMLDWDKPLSQQAQGVRDAVAPLLRDVVEQRPYAGGWGALEPDANAVKDLYTKSGINLGLYSNSDAQTLNLSGSGVIKALGKGDKESWKASEALRRAGIPGIRYLDGGSRKSGEGTYNYVVFPGMEGLLKILSRE